MYKFYNYPDHDTPTLSSTLSPEFNDVRSYQVIRGTPLQQYLLHNVSTDNCIIIIIIAIALSLFQELEVYVFDDTDPNDNNYVGVAKVSLHLLANGKDIKGTYPLYSVSIVFVVILCAFWLLLLLCFL